MSQQVHPSTGVSPAELLMSHRPRSLLDVARPDIYKNVCRAQEHTLINTPALVPLL